MYILLSCQKIRGQTIPLYQVSGIKYLCYGFAALCFIFSTFLCFAVHADLLYLKGSDYGINVEINKSDRDSVTVTIPKWNIVDVMVNALNDISYPDSLKLKYNNRALHCKVLETKETVIITRIPIIEIVSFNISLTDTANIEDIYKTRTNKEKFTPGIQNSLENLHNKNDKQAVSKHLGMVKGAILSKGSLLAKCQVRIYRLVPTGFLFFKRYKLGNHYEMMTDNNGNYMFKNIPEGSYKLFWKKSLGEPWMKSIETEPDIFVSGGKQTITAPFDIDPG